MDTLCYTFVIWDYGNKAKDVINVGQLDDGVTGKSSVVTVHNSPWTWWWCCGCHCRWPWWWSVCLTGRVWWMGAGFWHGAFSWGPICICREMGSRYEKTSLFYCHTTFQMYNLALPSSQYYYYIRNVWWYSVHSFTAERYYCILRSSFCLWLVWHSALCV